MNDNFLPNNVKNRVFDIRKKIKKVIFFVVVFLLFLYFFFFFFLSAPANFPTGTIFKIEPRSSLRAVSLKLKNEHIIRSRLIFEALVIILNGEKHVVSANYYFENKLPVWKVAQRISKGEHHLAPIVVTIPEGFDISQIGDAFFSKLVNFDKSKFITEAKGLEGYLFPDTYFFLNTDTESDVFTSMRDNFEKKMLALKPAIVSSGKTEKDIITMASLIEREAKGDIDRKLISGILWKRIAINMPLQVDAAPETYKVAGLPKNPICNPGLLAIKSAILPQSSPYLYYLHDKNGNIHYARTFAEHEANVLKYLK